MSAQVFDETQVSFKRPEVQVALRNHGNFLEAMKHDITPTGMHYLLIHYDVPHINASTYTVNIGGLVQRELNLSLKDIMQRPSVDIAVTLECAGNGRAFLLPRGTSMPWHNEAFGTAVWTGCRLKDVLSEAGLLEDATEILFTGRDRGVEGNELQYYQRSLSIAEATLDDVILAYRMNGEPLLPQHGFPLRVIVPGWYGMASVKWLDRIEAIGQSFNGYQMRAYTLRKSSTEPATVDKRISTIRVRSLMIPPGIPSFPLRNSRYVEAGTILIQGRAWAGRNKIVKVDFSSDNGKTWRATLLDTPLGKHAWVGWSTEWQANPGQYVLCSRATDEAGNVQPWEGEWNVGCFVGNMIHRVPITVFDTFDGLEGKAREWPQPPKM